MITKPLIRLFLSVLIFLPAPNLCSAQDSSSNGYIDISKISLEYRVIPHISSVFILKDENPVTHFSQYHFTAGIANRFNLPNSAITKKLLLKLNITNTADSASSVYFCPGFYYKKIRIFRVSKTGLQLLPDSWPSIPDSIGFRKITLQSHDSATIVTELTFVKTYNNTVVPRFINPSHLPGFIAELHTSYRNSDLITYVFCGLLLMMILYSFANYLQGANPEFLYYSIYTLLFASMLFLQSLMHFRYNQFSFFLEGYFDFILQGVGIIFYMLFMRGFLSTRQKYPFLYRLYNLSISILFAALLVYSYLHQLTDSYQAEFVVETSTKIFLLLLVLVFLIYSSLHWDDILLRYLFWGNFFLFIFALLSQLGILFSSSFKQLPGVFSSSLFYYELGLFLELVFFLAGLNHKNRRRIIHQTKEREMLKAQNLLKEYEKEIAVYKAQQEERQRISADMHDELGAGMTAIRLMSEIARNKMKENTPVEINKISQSANDVLNKMNAIIWSMNSGNDSLDNFVSYIRSYAYEYFDNTPTQCKVVTPEIIPDIELTGDKRRNLFLAIKESLNNVMKHAGAAHVLIAIKIDSLLQITITDDGKGIDLDNLRQFGNGLKNISRRMDAIGGTFSISNEKGTVSRFELAL